MIENLTDSETIANAARRVQELIAAHAEWLCVRGGRATALRKGECDFRLERGRLIFSCLSEEGAQVWRVTGWKWTGEKLLLETSRHMDAERGQLELVPRASIQAMTASISAARSERSQWLAERACELSKGATTEHVGLSAGTRPGQPGPFARIILRHRNVRVAVAGVVAEKAEKNADAFLSSTLIWFSRACERARSPFIKELWLIVERELSETLAQRIGLLRDELRRIISLYRIETETGELARAEVPEFSELLTKQCGRLKRPGRETCLSESAEKIVALAPDTIEVVRSRHGETLRFHGLAFARVRRLMKMERVWFGIEKARRRILDEETAEECAKLLNDLKTYRRAGAVGPSHVLYRAAPEAWLESLLRRDITRLDPGLRLAPLYTQFRPSQAGGSRPIDLLALRRDGRLAVIELKVTEDREHVLQGAAYWLEVEAHRRAGNIARARLFGDAKIADEPALVYLVAPLLRFHRNFGTLARSLAPEIEIYRFDINEDWRAGVKVLRRGRAG